MPMSNAVFCPQNYSLALLVTRVKNGYDLASIQPCAFARAKLESL